jgi:hypothetical protein
MNLGPGYHRLWSAAAISTLGDGIFLAALPLLAATLSRDPLRVSLVAFAGWLPWLLFGLLSGALVDRWDRRRMMWTVDAVRFVVVGALGVAVLAGWATIPLLAVVGFLLGVGQTLFDNPAQSLIPTLVSRDTQRLERANSQLYGAQTVSQNFAGPPAGGALFALAASVPFLTDAVSFAASSTLIATIRGGSFAAQRPDGTDGADEVRVSLRADIAEGLRWLLGHRPLQLSITATPGPQRQATPATKHVLGRGPGLAQSSAHRLLHQRADPCLVGGGQLRQSEGGRPHGAFVEVRLVAEAERRVPGVELLRALEEADDLAVLGIRGHPVPESRREGWRAGFDDGMEPLAHGTIRSRHLGDLREHGAFPVRLVRARAAARGGLQLLGALLHRGSFLVRESLELLVGRGGALGGLLRVLHCRFLPCQS